jgi:hypothetical protein
MLRFSTPRIVSNPTLRLPAEPRLLANLAAADFWKT